MTFNPDAFLQTVTTHPGVYQMLGEKGEVLYVGKAKNLKKRLASYFSTKQKDTKTLALLKHVQAIQVTITQTENDALLLECNLIKKHKPHYNILFRDDKTYPYIFISDENPYPSISLYRGQKKALGRYFGPYPSSHAVKETIYLIQKLFGLRLQSDKFHPQRKRPCLSYQIGLCSGACAGIPSIGDYQEDVSHAILFLQGKHPEIERDLTNQMIQASDQLHYERAALLRNQLAKLREIQARQYISTQHGDVDVIGFAMQHQACIHLLVIRAGRMLGSRAFFPTIPEGATPDEIVSSFISQHYLSAHRDRDTIPKEIILDIKLKDHAILLNALSLQRESKVHFAYDVRSLRNKWLEMANNNAAQALSGVMA